MKIDKLKLKYENYEEIPCEIPCSLFAALHQNGYLPHPYKDDNERLYLDAAKKDCIFEAEFNFIPKQDKVYVLSAGCIDTISQLFLNGKYIGETDNAFYPKKIELACDAFVRGKNKIQIRITSPVTYLQNKAKKHLVDCLMDNSQVGLFGRACMRKPLYSFGWDWGAALPDMGIYTPITIEEKKTELQDFIVRQIHEQGKVTLLISSNTSCVCKLYDPNGVLIGETNVGVNDGKIEVVNPRLWWCNNCGEQPLYTLQTEYKDEFSSETLLDIRTIGLRTIEIVQQNDRFGRSFGFVLNGKDIFAMGANYIPEDQILPWCSEEKTENLLIKCKEANFNMIRVWGGGLYASEQFYSLCDKLGIIVWQDFMFACQSVYLTEDFKNSVREEVRYQVQRIVKHPSLGLICGNNELEAMIADRSAKSYSCTLHRPWLDAMDYMELFEHIIPDICDKYAPDTFYWPCSPSSGGGFYMAQNEAFGDSHLWLMWGLGKPFDNYKNYFPRFCSEYGWISYPDMNTLAECSDTKIVSVTQEVVQSHFKKLLYDPNYQTGYEEVLTKTFGQNVDISQKLKNSQFLQGILCKAFIEHMRIHRQRCRGSLYWQLNDTWPCVSWSTIDYFGKEKLSHKMISEAYSPVIVTAEYDSERYLNVYVSNESMQQFEGFVRFTIDGEDKVIMVSVAPFHVDRVYKTMTQNGPTIEAPIVLELLDGQKNSTIKNLIYVC